MEDNTQAVENKLYVGNLSYQVDDAMLSKYFAEAGEVVEAKVIVDKMSGRSKGFGFVTMADAEMAKKAIEMLNEKDMDGRKIRVSIARPMKPRE